MIKGLISTTTRLASAIFIVSTIAACGGGGGSESGSGFIPAPPPEGANLDVTLGDANGNTITEITPLKAGLFRVVVTAPDGNPLPQEVVTGEASLGTLQPESGTALTNDFTQSLEEAANSAPDQLTVKLTLANGSVITETYTCRVDRCADDPALFPDFSPSPPACG